MGVAAHSTLGVQTFRREGRASSRGLTESVGTDVLTEAGNKRFRAAIASLCRSPAGEPEAAELPGSSVQSAQSITPCPEHVQCCRG